jgi:hypothetical protein
MANNRYLLFGHRPHTVAAQMGVNRICSVVQGLKASRNRRRRAGDLRIVDPVGGDDKDVGCRSADCFQMSRDRDDNFDPGRCAGLCLQWIDREYLR